MIHGFTLTAYPIQSHMAAEKLSFAEQMLAESGVNKPSENEYEERSLVDGPAPKDERSFVPKEVDQKPEKEDEDEEDPVIEKTAATTTPAPAAPPAENPAPPATGPAPANPAVIEDEIPEEKLLEALRKKTGRDFKSLSDLSEAAKPEPTAEEKLAAAQEHRSKAIEFGKTHKLFSQTEYDQYIRTTASTPLEIVKNDFTTKLRTQDPNITAEEASDAFEEVYHIHEDQDTWKYKEGQALLANQHEQLMRKNFGSIMDIEKVYDDVQKETVNAANYKNEITSLFDKSLPQKFEFTIGDETVSFPLNLSDTKTLDLVNGIKKGYLTMDMMKSSTGPDGKVDKEALLSQITQDLKAAVLEDMVKEVATAYSNARLTKAKMGRRGAAIDLSTETTDRDKPRSTLGIADQLMEEAKQLGMPV